MRLDWQPNCATAELTEDATSGAWVGTFTLPAGTWEYKIAHDDTWDVNFGADGTRNGGNLSLTTKGGAVRFSYDPTTHLVTTTEG